jgi:hypothetical protein
MLYFLPRENLGRINCRRPPQVYLFRLRELRWLAYWLFDLVSSFFVIVVCWNGALQILTGKMQLLKQ